MKKTMERVLKFLFGGGLSVIFNVLIIYLLVEFLGFDTPALRRLANLISVEIALIISFLIYRTWVWPDQKSGLRKLLFGQLPLYHLSAGLALLLRAILIFPVLDKLGVHYLVNTLIGVIVGAIINYVMNDRLIFANSTTRYAPKVSKRKY